VSDTAAAAELSGGGLGVLTGAGTRMPGDACGCALIDGDSLSHQRMTLAA
jgi:hypothetical protein